MLNKKYIRFLLFMITPEDTTAKLSINREVNLLKTRTKYALHKSKHAGQIKALFWIFVVILFSLGLAKLK